MLNFRKITTLLSLLLLSTLVTSCGCGKTEQDKEAKRLAKQKTIASMQAARKLFKQGSLMKQALLIMEKDINNLNKKTVDASFLEMAEKELQKARTQLKGTTLWEQETTAGEIPRALKEKTPEEIWQAIAFLQQLEGENVPELLKNLTKEEFTTKYNTASEADKSILLREIYTQNNLAKAKAAALALIEVFENMVAQIKLHSKGAKR